MFSYLRSTTSTEMHRAPRDCKGAAAVILAALEPKPDFEEQETQDEMAVAT